MFINKKEGNKTLNKENPKVESTVGVKIREWTVFFPYFILGFCLLRGNATCIKKLKLGCHIYISVKVNRLVTKIKTEANVSDQIVIFQTKVTHLKTPI